MKQFKCYTKKLLAIRNVDHVSLRLHCEQRLIKQIAACPEPFYKKTRQEPKSSGGFREITPPKKQLMEIQKKINALLQEVILPETFYGGVKRKNNIGNAKHHKGKKFVGCFDIKEFFPNIKRNRVKGVFILLGCSVPVARMLSKLTTYNGTLPQGAPTSSTLANLVMAQQAFRIEALAKKHKLEITFFQDDVAVSGEFDINRIRRLIIRIFEQIGFSIHTGEKLQIREQSRRQSVTGIVVNKKLNVPKEKIDSIRKGLLQGKSRQLSKKEVMSLRGKIGYVVQVNPEKGKKLLKKLEVLQGKIK